MFGPGVPLKLGLLCANDDYREVRLAFRIGQIRPALPLLDANFKAKL
ncbi:MAG: hypothetical protein RL230_2340 [Pseudomonadota bacterium]|jgi:hypothetical protein